MSKEHLEQFMTQVADTEELQAKIGKEITGDTLVALGAAHGCEFTIEDVQENAELSDAQMKGVAGGILPRGRDGAGKLTGGIDRTYGLGKVREKLYCIVGTGC